MARHARLRLARERQVARVVQVFLKFFSIELLAGLLILVVAQVWRLMQIGEWGTLNWRIAMRAAVAPTPGPDEIALVQIDERSAREWPTRDMVPRDYLASLIEKIEEAGPKVVAIDVFLGGPGADPRADSLLAEVFDRYSNLVLASEIEPQAGSDYFVEYRPYEKLLPAEGTIPVVGHTMFASRNGLAFGRIPIAKTPEHGYCPSFALATYLASTGIADDGDARLKLQEWVTDEPRTPENEALATVLRKGLAGTVLPVNFLGRPERTFKRTYPAYAVLGMSERILRLALAGRIVLVGATYRNARDKLYTPVATRAPMDGVEIHANVVADYLLGQHVFPSSPALSWLLNLLAIGLTVFLFHRYLFLRAIEILTILLLVFWFGAFAAFLIGQPQWIPIVDPTLLSIGTALFMIFYKSMRVDLARDEIQRLWGPRLADSQLVELEEQLATSERLVTAASGQSEVVTVVALRLHGLLQLMEKSGLREQKLLRMVDQFIDVMQEEIVFAERHRGATDRFFGETLLVFCGVPIAQSDRDEAIKAVRIAFEAKQHFGLLVKDWERSTGFEIGDVLRLGIAVHTGNVVVGAIHNRTGEKEYAILGEMIHDVTALESLTQTLGANGTILISSATAALVRDFFQLEKVHLARDEFPSTSLLSFGGELFRLVGPAYQLNDLEVS